MSGSASGPDPSGRRPWERFSDRVTDYVSSRPTYPAEVVAALSEFGLRPQAVVADLGAGTGIFSELLLGAGAVVHAVEPNGAMLAAARERLGTEPRFHGVQAGAEATTLPTDSVDLVTAAQAFHWFDADRTAAECRRILRPGGRVVLIWNTRLEEETEFLREYEALLRRFGTDYAAVRARQSDRMRVLRFFGGQMEVRSFPNAQHLGLGELRRRLLSSSYTPPAGHPDREPMLLALEESFQRHAEAGRVGILYRTELYAGLPA